MSRKLRMSTTAMFLLLSLVCQGCSESAGNSPQDAFNALAAAGRKQDYHDYCELITPESVDQLAAGMLGAAEATVVTFEKKITRQNDDDRQRYERVVKVLAKHEIDSKRASAAPDISDRASGAEFLQALQSQQQAAVDRIKDKPGFIDDMMKAVETESSQRLQEETRSTPTPELSNVVITGDRAVGSYPYMHNGEELTITNRFRKIAGVWKVDLMPESNAK